MAGLFQIRSRELRRKTGTFLRWADCRGNYANNRPGNSDDPEPSDRRCTAGRIGAVFPRALSFRFRCVRVLGIADAAKPVWTAIPIWSWESPGVLRFVGG